MSYVRVLFLAWALVACRVNFDRVPAAGDASGDSVGVDATSCTQTGLEIRGDGSCSDSVDNDCDGLTDHGDPGCPGVRLRSVGVAAASLATSSVDVAGDLATFSIDLPARVGIGDVVVIYLGGNEAIGFVRERIDARTLRLVDAIGRPLIGRDAIGVSAAVFRAFVGMDDLNSLVENPALPAAVRDFDTSRNLVTSDVALVAACYDDGIDQATVRFDTWTTSEEHYLRLFTPVSKSEVGVSQRHAGVYGVGYRLEAGDPFPALEIDASHVRVEGLSFGAAGSGSDKSALVVISSDDDIDVRISHNILRGNNAANTDGILHLEADGPGAGGRFHNSNNIAYGANVGSSECMWHRNTNGANVAFFIYHNTVWDCPRGIEARDTAGKALAINNISLAIAGPLGPVAFFEYNGPGEFHPSSSNNVSSDATAANIGQPALTGQTPAQTLRDVSSEDLRLSGTAPSIGFGIDLRLDPNLPVLDDIEGDLRPVGASDPGADQN